MADDKTPPANPAAANNPYTQSYVVQSGDTLSKIAQKYYGDAALYTKIFQANRDILSDPNKIQVGQKLRIP
jgi:nucleoid-associated protein YgaU